MNVIALEERSTPAVADNFLAPIHAPLAVLVAPIPPIAIPAQTPVANNGTANASVRSDLFGVGDAGKPEHANELEEMLANDRASKEDAACEPTPSRQETAVAEQAANANGTVMIEDMVYVPPVE